MRQSDKGLWLQGDDSSEFVTLQPGNARQGCLQSSPAQGGHPHRSLGGMSGVYSRMRKKHE